MGPRDRTPLDYLLTGLAVAIIVAGVAGLRDALFARVESGTQQPGAAAGRSPFDELWGREPFAGRKRVVLLLAGVDERKNDIGRADTILIAFMSPKTKRVALLAVPRDLRVKLPCDLPPKINHAYACKGKMLALKQVIEDLIGEPVDYYAKANFEGFQKFVEELDGVDIQVKDYMQYDDNWGNLHVNFEPGRYHMDGYMAMCYVRYRQPNAKLYADKRYRESAGTDSRLARQQQFLQAMIDQKLKFSEAVHLIRVLPTLLNWVETDISPGDGRELAAFFRQVDAENVFAEHIPHGGGKIGGVYYDTLLEDEYREMRRIMDERLDGPPAGPCTVEILNGSGQPHVATIAAAQLKQSGFEATQTGNAASDGHARTVVTYQPGFVNHADKVCRLLKCGHITPETDPLAHYPGEAKLRITLGEDYQPPAGLKEAADQALTPDSPPASH